jgi:beta-galactosidase
VLIGSLDRRLQQNTLPIQLTHKDTRLDILVENTGRVNYGRLFPNERAGITHRVTLSGAELSGWQIYPLPMNHLDTMDFKQGSCIGACFYRAEFKVEKPADTFVDMRQFGKGMVWVNGSPLGRFWKIGPQRTLYLPAPWLKEGTNEIVVFDLEGEPGRIVPFLDKAMPGETSD